MITTSRWGVSHVMKWIVDYGEAVLEHRNMDPRWPQAGQSGKSKMPIRPKAFLTQAKTQPQA
eukprot:3889108-Karenia_brevis.AAC.1